MAGPIRGRSGRGRANGLRWRAPALAIAVVGVTLLTLAPVGSGAKPLHPKYLNGCNPATYGDPYIRVASGTYGIVGTAWTEGFSSGRFNLSGVEYASAHAGGKSIYDVWPWIHFGPGATTCVVPSANVPTRLSFTFAKITWSVNLSVNCSADSRANASYALNVTGDLYDYSTATWLVSPTTHVNTLVAEHSVACSGFGNQTYSAGPFTRARAEATSGSTTYTLLSGDEYFYFAQARLEVSATTTGTASAYASVGSVSMRLSGAHCTGC